MLSRKRQRRSYSCGPCKMLKIKCDLQLPCASCIKFKREDKCRLDPPNPPSEEELKLIKERRQRMSKRKTTTESNYPPPPNYVPSQVQENIPSSQVPQVSQVPPVSQLQLPQLPHIHGPPLSQPPSLPQVPISITSHPATNNQPSLSMPMGTMMAKPNVSMYHLPSTSQQLPPSPPDDELSKAKIEEFFKSQAISFSFQDTSPNTLQAHLLSDGKSIFESDIERERNTMITLSKEDVNQLKLIYPSNTMVLKLFLNYFSCFNRDLLELIDYGLIVRWSLTFFEQFSLVHYNNEMSMDYYSFRILAVTLSIMSLGLLAEPTLQIVPNYSSESLIKIWISMSRNFRDRTKKADTLLDIVHLMIWYLAIENYYEFENNLLDNYFEYNNLLSILLFNKEYMDTIINKKVDLRALKINDKRKFNGFKLILKYWLRIRTIELDILYFQYKSSLLKLNLRFKNSIIPNREILKIIYDDDDDSLSGVKNEIQRYIFKMAQGYFNQFHDTVNDDARQLVKSYLSVYCTFFQSVGHDIDPLEKEFHQNLDNKNIDKNDLLLYSINQVMHVGFVKWLSVKKIETINFPSLRYTTYITSILTMFNHYIYLDKFCNNYGGLLHLLIKELSDYHIKYLIHGCIINQVFLILLKTSINHYHPSPSLIDLNKLYNKVESKFNNFYHNFVKEFESSKLIYLPSFKQSMDLLKELKELFSTKVIFNSNLSTDEVIKLLQLNLTHYQLLINSYFGCKDTMTNYINNLWELFNFVKSNNGPVYITKNITFDNDLIFGYEHRFVGFEINDDIVDEYIETVVEPLLKD